MPALAVTSKVQLAPGASVPAQLPPVTTEKLAASAAPVLCATAALQQSLGHHNADNSWLISVAEQWLGGAKPYVDVLETNPPGAFLIYAPAAALAGLLGLRSELVVSALIFGAAHIANPGATLWSSATIAIGGGLLFGLVYHVTRSLPVCMGLHAAWNFAQGTIYGIPVSGNPADGWLVSTRSGPDWLSGGVFGAEASVVALGLCLLCTLALLVIALRRGSIVPCRPWQVLLQRFSHR